MKVMVLFLLLVTALQAADPTPEDLLRQGVAFLKEEKLVEAVKVLAQASEAFEKAGNDDKAAEVNSLLYWSKKRMTLADANALQSGHAEAAKRAEAVVERKVEASESKSWLDKANEYAKRTDDPLLKAVRYFEVAERFKGSPEGMEALDQSLKLMKQVSLKASAAPAGKAEKGDGKIYVQSKPVGAQILVVQGGELRDTGLKTPSLVQLPVGRAELLLRLAKHDEAKMAADVTTSISKPEAIVMEPEKFDLEVTAAPELGDAWDVMVDGKPAMDKAGKPAVAPCTVRVAEGARSIQLVKDGFVDPAAVRVTVKGENPVVMVKGRAQAGKSAVLAKAVMEKAARLQRKTFQSSLSSVPFDVGQKLFGNRDYAVTDIANAIEFKGWAVIQVNQKTGELVTVTLNEQTTVLMGVKKDGTSLALENGFVDTGRNFKSTGAGQFVERVIFSKRVQGKLVLPPSDGYILIIESKP